jgi:hypothetical protein
LQRVLFMDQQVLPQEKTFADGHWKLINLYQSK